MNIIARFYVIHDHLFTILTDIQWNCIIDRFDKMQSYKTKYIYSISLPFSPILVSIFYDLIFFSTVD